MSESLIIVLAETAGLTDSSAFFMKYSHQHVFCVLRFHSFYQWSMSVRDEFSLLPGEGGGARQKLDILLTMPWTQYH